MLILGSSDSYSIRLSESEQFMIILRLQLMITLSYIQ